VNTFTDVLNADRLFLILKFASEGNGGSNSGAIKAMLTSMQHNIAGDKKKADLSKLERIGLVEIINEGKITTFSITNLGDDVANGRASVPDVRAPRPSEK
jgi:hypothetical protein